MNKNKIIKLFTLNLNYLIKNGICFLRFIINYLINTSSNNNLFLEEIYIGENVHPFVIGSIAIDDINSYIYFFFYVSFMCYYIVNKTEKEIQHNTIDGIEIN